MWFEPVATSGIRSARVPDSPLSTPLSHLLVAFTIELDNEFELRMRDSVATRPFRVSVVMWSNLLRVVRGGITVGSLPEATGLSAKRMRSTLGGMERWGYVEVGPEEAHTPQVRKRDGFGSARGLENDWVVRPTEVGQAAQETWPQLFDEIESRWDDRFGADHVRRMRRTLTSFVERLDTRLPEYLPIVASTNGMAAEAAEPKAPATAPVPLSALLSQVLLAYTIEFEKASTLSLPLVSNLLRVIDTKSVAVAELSTAAAVSSEAISMALTYLTKKGFAEVDRRAKVAQLTPKGVDALDSAPALHSAVVQGWKARVGSDDVDRLRTAMDAILEQRDGARMRLALGLRPHPDGWRASGRYLKQTEAMLADPRSGLPAYPMVLHRGGWPDGS
jgi:predicted transcriptional regulator